MSSAGGEDEGQEVQVLMAGHAATFVPDLAAAGPTIGVPMEMPGAGEDE